MKMRRSDRIFEGVIMAFLVLVCLLTLYPLIYIVSQSFSAPKDVFLGTVTFLPKNISLKSYQEILHRQEIWRGYLNTIIYAVIGTVISLVLSLTAAFALSRKRLIFRRFFVNLFLIPMFFSGGLIPLYLLISSLGLMNTMFAFILPGCLSVWNVIIIRTYITSSIPFELQESAMLDGANDLRIFVVIILPLCKPIIAIMALFAIVSYWNSYFNALIFFSDDRKYPLQMILRSILIEKDILQGGNIGSTTAEQAHIAEGIKYSSIVVSTLPILLAYPFFSKYFEKGMMVGSLKG